MFILKMIILSYSASAHRPRDNTEMTVKVSMELFPRCETSYNIDVVKRSIIIL